MSSAVCLIGGSELEGKLYRENDGGGGATRAGPENQTPTRVHPDDGLELSLPTRARRRRKAFAAPPHVWKGPSARHCAAA